MVAMPAQYQIIHSPVQNAMGGAHLHTPQSIFQHMMGQQNAAQQAGPWLQMPQVPPLSMPWSVPALQQPDLIRFTGERNLPNYGLQLHQKRKLDTPDITDTRQTKQFITEEKMAAHFQGLHISSSYQNQNSDPSTSAACDSQSLCSKEMYTDLEMDGTDSLDIKQCKNVEPRLVISDELKRLQQEPMLPATLLSKLERPSMALVLWEPPSKHLRVLSTTRSTPTPIPNSPNDNNNNNNNNNNSESIPDLNQALSEDSTMVVLEPMDL